LYLPLLLSSNCTRWGALAILFAFPMISMRCSTGKSVEIILFNGKVITVDEAFSIHGAVAIRDGKFLKVGSEQEIMALAGNHTEVIDLEGHAVIPGLIEGHAHPTAASQSEVTDTIPVVETIEQVLDWIKAEARRKEDNEWIIHPKFFITRMEDRRQISLKELDAAAPANPVFLNGSYGAVINSKAMERSEMTRLKHPGIIVDDKTGQRTGVIRRSAFSLLAIPPRPDFSAEQESKALEKLFRLYNSVGFTSIVSGGGSVNELKAFEELLNKDALTVRIFHNVRVPLDLRKSQPEVTEEVKALGTKTGDGNEWLKTGALKVVVDGGMLTGTAFLHEAWGEKAKDLYGINDPNYRGELMLSKEELVKVITAADEAGWKFTAHVTGGAGVDTLLAAYETVDRSRPIDEKRFSIIHGNFFTPEAIEKMATMGIYADMQPAWFYKDTDLLHDVLGKERINTFHPYRSLVDAGVIVNAGSDHMVKMDPDQAINPYNPFTAMWSLVTRKTTRGTVYNPEQAVSREHALKMYTINNAMASFEEGIKGSIEAGKLADLVVISDDILTCHPDSIREIKALLTMVGGKVVYDSDKLNTATQR
jgi:predicted amidohydrolase YtcJ